MCDHATIIIVVIIATLFHLQQQFAFFNEGNHKTTMASERFTNLIDKFNDVIILSDDECVD